MSNVKIFTGLFLLSLILRVGIVLTYQFSGVYGQDPYLYLNLAENLATRGENIATIGSISGMHLSSPMGYPLIVAVLYKVFGIHDILAQLVSLLLGALTPAVAFLFFRRLFILNNIPNVISGAVIGSLFIGLSPENIRLSMVCLADATGLFFVVAGMLAAATIAEEPTLWRGAALGACFALAVMSRFGNAALVIPLILLVLSFRQPREALKPGIAALLTFIVFFIPQIVSFLHVTTQWYYEGYLHGVSVGNLFKTEFRSAAGNDVEIVKVPNIIYYTVLGFAPGFATPVGAIAGLFAVWKYPKNKIILFSLVWLAVLWIMLCILPFQNSRFFLPAYIPICIVAGIGGAEFFAMLKSAKVRKAVMVSVLLFALPVSVAFSEARISKLVDTEREERVLVDWAKDCPAKNAVIFSCNVSNAFWHFTTMNAYDMYGMDTTVLDSITKVTEHYMVIDTLDLQQRWQGLPVTENVAWIRRHYTVQPIFSTSHYTVFKF